MNRILFGLCWVASAAALAGAGPVDSGSPADVLQLRNVEVTFHTAGSVLPDKDLELMMSLYAEDAVLTDTAHGNKPIRARIRSAATGGTWVRPSGPRTTG
jgi:hypothetical protein